MTSREWAANAGRVDPMVLGGCVLGVRVPPGFESGSTVTYGGWEGRKIESSVASAPHHVSDVDAALLKQNKW